MCANQQFLKFEFICFLRSCHAEERYKNKFQMHPLTNERNGEINHTGDMILNKKNADAEPFANAVDTAVAAHASATNHFHCGSGLCPLKLRRSWCKTYNQLLVLMRFTLLLKHQRG